MEGLQPHQCKLLTTLKDMNYLIPWKSIEKHLKPYSIITRDLNDLHSILHKNGNSLFHYIFKCLENEVEPISRVYLITPNIWNLKFRFVWINIRQTELRMYYRDTIWYNNEQICRQMSAKRYPQYSICGEKLVLSIESICECLLYDSHDIGCTCLCHLISCWCCYKNQNGSLALNTSANTTRYL